MTTAILLVDIQNDFLKGGSLPSDGGELLLPQIYAFIKEAKQKGYPIYASRDWHPSNHMSFRDQNGPWPPHCVANTKGADFPPGFPVDLITKIISKGVSQDKDAYSAFEGTDFSQVLKDQNVKKLVVVGYCTEYCVKASALDSQKNGIDTVVVSGLCGAVEKVKATENFLEMSKNGIEVVSSFDFCMQLKKI